MVFDPSGGVNFGLNLDPTSTAIPTRITWKWRNTATNQVWRNGQWAVSSTPESQIWPLGDSSDGFAQRWQWNSQQAQVEARYRSGGAPAPFTQIGTANLLQNFFQGQASVGVVVDVKVEFQDGSTAETTTNTITVRPSFSSEIVTAMVMKADGQQLSHLYGRAGTLPNLEWTVTTSTALPNQVQVGIFKQGGTQIACETLENATSLFTQVTPVNGPNGKIYTLTAQSGSELFNLLSTQGAGRYEIRFSGAACSGGDWSSAQVSLITLNPNLAFRLRFHYRDHLGSSTVSRAYTPEYQTGIAGAATFSLKMSALGNQFVTLYAQPEKATNFTPFGKPMGDVNEEPNPRYTDHEFDAESGLNYMKGRYQLANFAKFNRPDPMRDWDWENPSSINLYQYVRNNPVMTEDPTGLMPGLVGLIMANQMAEMASKTAARAAVQAAASQAAKKQGVKLAGKKTAGRVVSKFLGPVGAILGAADAGWALGTYINSKTGLSEILAEELHNAINGEPQEWVPQVYDDNNFEIQGLVPEASSDGEKVIEKNSVINGYSVSNHAWRKGGLGRGATEEHVSSVIEGAKENETVTSTEGQGKFKGNTIKTYEHNGVKVTVDETRKVIISIRPSNNKEFRIMR